MSTFPWGSLLAFPLAAMVIACNLAVAVIIAGIVLPGLNLDGRLVDLLMWCEDLLRPRKKVVTVTSDAESV